MYANPNSIFVGDKFCTSLIDKINIEIGKKIDSAVRAQVVIRTKIAIHVKKTYDKILGVVSVQPHCKITDTIWAPVMGHILKISNNKVYDQTRDMLRDGICLRISSQIRGSLESPKSYAVTRLM